MNEPLTQVEPTQDRGQAWPAQRTGKRHQNCILRRVGTAIWVLVAASFAFAAVAWSLLLQNLP